MTGRELPPTSPFAADDGAPDLALAAALEGADAERTARVVAALATARVLVPVMAQVEVAGSGAAGLTVDKEASTGVVALRTPDGRTALPVFSGTAALARWHAAARPVPAEGPRAAASALQEGWGLLVVDPGGPATTVVPRPAVVALATGRDWRPAVTATGVRTDIQDAVRRALDGVAGVDGVDVVPGTRSEVAVVLRLRAGLQRSELDVVVQEVGLLLAADELVAQDVDSLELVVRRADPQSSAP